MNAQFTPDGTKSTERERGPGRPNDGHLGHHLSRAEFEAEAC